jgi:hypothetical protein
VRTGLYVCGAVAAAGAAKTATLIRPEQRATGISVAG